MNPPEHGTAANTRRDQIYEWVHIANEFASAGWFLTGSLFLLSPGRGHTGAWLFVAGSGQILVGPVLRVLQKIPGGRPRGPAAPS